MGEVVRSGRETVAEPVAGTRGGGTVRPFLSPVTRGRRQRQVASPVRERARQRGSHGSERESERSRGRESRVPLRVLSPGVPPPFLF